MNDSRILVLTAVFIGSITLHASELIEPIPVYPEDEPLLVESPIKIRWLDLKQRHVRIHKGSELVFPRPGESRALESGVEFFLDPGTYALTVSDTSLRGDSVTTHIYVSPLSKTYDLRELAPAVNSQLREVCRLLEEAASDHRNHANELGALSGDVEDLADRVDHNSETLSDLHQVLCELRDQFVVVEKVGSKKVSIERPLQHMFDHFKTLERKLMAPAHEEK